LVGQANPTESTVVRTAAALLVFYFSLVRTPLFCSAVGLRPPGARGVRQRRLAAVGRSSPLLFILPALERPTAFSAGFLRSTSSRAERYSLPSLWFSPFLSPPPPVRRNGASTEKKGALLRVVVCVANFDARPVTGSSCSTLYTCSRN
jgi:hypothetical protein